MTGFSPDGNVLVGHQSGAITGFDRTLKYWRAPTWAEIETLEAATKTAP